jgi:uncharacterized membrane protein
VSQQTLIQRLRPYLEWLVVIAILMTFLAPNAGHFVRYFERVGFHPHAPDWALAASLPLKVQVHVTAALAALAIGMIILLLPKGRRFHKTLGWAWVLAMGTAAVSSLFIVELNGGFWSFLHIISGWTIVGMPMAIYAVRNGKVLEHKRGMTGMFVGGLIVAGALTFIPGRFFYAFFFG